MELPTAGMTCLEFIASIMGYLVPTVAVAFSISAAGDVVRVGYEWITRGSRNHVR